MTIKEAINYAIIMLKNENVESPKNKARMIMEATLSKTKEYIMIYDKKEITPEERDKYIKNVKKLISGIPIQYIIGKQEFMKLNFLVNKNVLIPRADTEILVEEVIKIASNIQNVEILDLCTGSGAIAISIAKYVSNSKICATDISDKAISVAKQNAQLNGVINNIKFIQSNLFEKINNQKFDIIVSNPPYIETSTIKTLAKDVQNEPRIALDGGKDGLKFYKKITNHAIEYLKPDGYLCLEIGYNQKIPVQKILQDKKIYKNIYYKKDLCENDRVIIANI